MTIEKRPNATADKNAPTQVPAPVEPRETTLPGPKLPGPPGVAGTERFRLLAYVKQESMVRVDKRPDETVLTWPHLLRAELLRQGHRVSVFTARLSDDTGEPGVYGVSPTLRFRLQRRLASIAGGVAPGPLGWGRLIAEHIAREDS